MYKYIKCSDESTSYPEIYGYLLHSSMTEIDIMFCSQDESHLKECASTIYRILCVDGGDDSSDRCNEFCEQNGIDIVMDENDTLYTVDLRSWDDDQIPENVYQGDYLADIDGIQYKVNVIARDSSRF